MSAAAQYYSNQVTAAGSNFYYSFLFLPPEQRAAISAIYAFCRVVDDIVDECTDQQIAAQKLAWWQNEIDTIFATTPQVPPQHPISVALAQAKTRFALQKLWFDEILQGMQMDLRYQGYQTFADLKLYCHCVASAVGMLAASVFGFEDSKTLEYAKQLGIAFQLVNIIRDIGEDARRGRIYLPEEDLQAFGIQPNEILQLQIADPTQFTKLLRKYASLAREYYAMALASLPAKDRAAQRSGLIMAKIYFTILQEIENSDFAVLNQKISITPLRKLWITWCTWRTETKLCRLAR